MDFFSLHPGTLFLPVYVLKSVYLEKDPSASPLLRRGFAQDDGQ